MSQIKFTSTLLLKHMKEEDYAPSKAFIEETARRVWAGQST